LKSTEQEKNHSVENLRFAVTTLVTQSLRPDCLQEPCVEKLRTCSRPDSSDLLRNPGKLESLSRLAILPCQVHVRGAAPAAEPGASLLLRMIRSEDQTFSLPARPYGRRSELPPCHRCCEDRGLVGHCPCRVARIAGSGSLHWNRRQTAVWPESIRNGPVAPETSTSGDPSTFTSIVHLPMPPSRMIVALRGTAVACIGCISMTNAAPSKNICLFSTDTSYRQPPTTLAIAAPNAEPVHKSATDLSSSGWNYRERHQWTDAQQRDETLRRCDPQSAHREKGVPPRC
jgi:hypothetical protein